MFALIAEAIEIVETMLAEVHVDQSAFALRATARQPSRIFWLAEPKRL
jgi:hypothetical protein